MALTSAVVVPVSLRGWPLRPTRPSTTSRICARAIFFHPLLDDTNCSDQFTKGALAEVWGGRVVYSGLIDDGDPPGDFFNYTGAISWTGELGFSASRVGSCLRPASCRALMILPPDRRHVSWHVIWDAFKSVIPPAALIVMVLGSIFAGITTPTEASGVGALGATLLAWYNKKLSFAVIKDVLHATFNTTAYIFAIFLGATCFALVLRELGGDALIESVLIGLPFGQYGVLIVILGLVFLLGFLLDWIEITLIILPLLSPVAAAWASRFKAMA